MIRYCGCGCRTPLPAGASAQQLYVDERHKQHAYRERSKRSSDDFWRGLRERPRVPRNALT